MAEIPKLKCTSGEHVTESDNIYGGQGTLSLREIAVERWLQNDVAHAYDAHMADPTRPLSLDEGLAQVQARIANCEGRY